MNSMIINSQQSALLLHVSFQFLGALPELLTTHGGFSPCNGRGCA